VAKLHQRADEGDLKETFATELTSTHVNVGKADLTKSSSIVAPALIDELTEVDMTKITKKFESEAETEKNNILKTGPTEDEVNNAKEKLADGQIRGQWRYERVIARDEQIKKKAEQAYDAFIETKKNEITDVVKKYSAISFSGGGSEFVFEDSGEAETVDKETFTYSMEIKGGVSAELKFSIFGLGSDGKLGAGELHTWDDEEGTEDIKSHSSTRSFTLSDPDDGDAFDVQVWQLVS
jgi:hypothetical protein